MRYALLLLQLSLCVSLSDAFFPWFPSYRCHEDSTCTTTKKREQVSGDAPSTEDAVAVPRRARTRAFPIRQRTSITSHRNPDSDSIAREVNRLIAKYTGRQPEDTLPSGQGLEKRQNAYRVIKPAATTHTNSVGIYQDGSDFSYFLQAGFGSEGKKMFMLIDTGAATSWVMSSNCTSEACDLHASFGPDDSNTYEADPSGFSVRYGSGSVQGTKATDSVAIADMVLDRFHFGVVNQTSSDFNHFPFDGILGLSLANGHTDNFLKTVLEADVLDKGLFCVFLSRSGDGPNTGEISFGSCNPDKYTGDFSYTDVGSNNGDWAIPLDGITYGGQRAGDEQRLAYIDTGTSYVFGPKADVKAFHGNIPGSSSDDGTTWKVPCNSNKTVAYTFSGVSYNISSRDWLSRPDNDGSCTSNIYGHEVVRGAWLLGDLFLKNVYAAFDVDEKRIGTC
ncbi:acid protease [Sodiomyces alkalinus F11]|uniref:Acid protease n=1 Tax=Sodiomyces alkalinus (strain CBS 110278 / VKM F-3762 / F11) TaxID=1314773 RepID=A0A3N2Q9C3_SODAK|nr:acid protease [Sodiomyces alkalinus F11]ROT43235.1 acid protease [Sodiomyces alkalinus F11]